MNHSLHSADRATHLKIVVVALIAGISVAALGITARTTAADSQTAQVKLSGLGSATLLVREHLDVTITGAGSVRYLGGPTVDKNVTGVGSVESMGGE